MGLAKKLHKNRDVFQAQYAYSFLNMEGFPEGNTFLCGKLTSICRKCRFFIFSRRFSMTSGDRLTNAYAEFYALSNGVYRAVFRLIFAGIWHFKLLKMAEIDHI